MCWLMTFAVPNGVEKVECPRGLSVEAIQNLGSGNSYDPSLCLYTLTAGGCSCDLVRLNYEEKALAKLEKKQRVKYKKKGWSDSKIERAMKCQLQPMKSGSVVRADAEQFLRLLYSKNMASWKS